MLGCLGMGETLAKLWLVICLAPATFLAPWMISLGIVRIPHILILLALITPSLVWFAFHPSQLSRQASVTDGLLRIAVIAVITLLVLYGLFYLFLMGLNRP